MRQVALLILTAVLPISSALAAESPAELKIVDHVEHYQVTGTTYRTIQAQLETLAEVDGSTRHGSTRSTFEVISKLEKVGGRCRVLQQEIVVKITTVLPQWEPSRKVDAALQKQWQTSFERLVRHEAGHRQNVLQAASALRETLTELEPKERCLSARAGVDIALGNALDRLERREAYYDRLTRNGQRDLSAANDWMQSEHAGLQGKPSIDAFSKLRSTRSRKFPAE
ncbi:DUF922 domain-containing protein [Dokdonella sp.]|uniref:DUF922 domain-containing protein n=1 Tax=Dokdonella sp. TaxID=2291710 RepID=UPI003C5A2B7A